ncbi:amino acid adenylation domain-containing protein [Paenibacillus sp. FSL K6-4396]|uniref:amino acid adenylation domain-containing protein n=1 Tax=unclassified Paenibacillus TaxID=185978 RepID=UPI001783C01A|nr:amino acid adenylation domain-containing protein [Paenibacillus sp. CFBP 13594]MBD8839094.1 amino acid adenylation domain-containing protein [Paenibacillus sp. CFBP 13594]
MNVKDLTINKVFEIQAQKTPDKIALIYDGGTMTYSELNKKANQLARYLIQRNVMVGDIVTLQLKRSFEMVICILAVLKAGAVYLPLSVNEPVERLNYLLLKSNAKILLTDTELSAPSTVPFINIEEVKYDIFESSSLEIKFSSENLAYIIFTSGSTGEPKGVMVEHKSVVNFLSWRKEEHSLSDDDVLILKHSYTFDFSIFELFAWFFAGASLCILKQDEEKYPDILINKIFEHNVTSINFVTSAFKLFLDVAEHKDSMDKLKSLKNVYFGGEYLHHTLVEKFYSLFGRNTNTNLHHVYGPTETTIIVTCFSLSHDIFSKLSEIPIGKPIDNTMINILNEDLTECAVNEVGEIYISGACVARGYINDENLSSKSFLPDLIHQHGRMYKSGDLGKRTDDGNIVFVGRADNQVKIRGYRIELEEIEKMLMKYTDVTHALVMVHDHNALVCYYTSTKEIAKDTLVEYLAGYLPEYMIPLDIIRIDDFVYTSSGKIDRNYDYSLPEKSKVINNQPQLSTLEQRTLGIITRNLPKIPEQSISLEADLVSLGVNSVFFIKLIIDMEEEFDIIFDDNMLARDSFVKVKDFAEYITQKIN